MNTLTKQESRVLELIAWGAACKEIPYLLSPDHEISVETVRMHVKNIKAKLGLNKMNELSAWYFCHHFNIPASLSPLKRKVISIMLLVLMLPSLVSTNQYVRVRTVRARTAQMRVRPSRKDINTFNLQ